MWRTWRVWGVVGEDFRCGTVSTCGNGGNTELVGVSACAETGGNTDLVGVSANSFHIGVPCPGLPFVRKLCLAMDRTPRPLATSRGSARRRRQLPHPHPHLLKELGSETEYREASSSSTLERPPQISGVRQLYPSQKIPFPSYQRCFCREASLTQGLTRTCVQSTCRLRRQYRSRPSK